MPPNNAESQRKSSKKSSDKRRRLTLMESYGAAPGAFSDAHLQDISAKIKGVTDRRTAQPASDNDQTPPAADPSGVSIDESIEVSITQSIDTSIETPIQTLIETPIDTTHATPNEISNDLSHQTPNEKTHQTLNAPPILFTESQAVLYYCLRQLDGAVTSLNRISQEVGISEHTLRGCLSNLAKKGAIHYGGRSNYGGRIGFTAKALACNVVLRGDKHRLLQKLDQINYRTLMFAQPLDDDLPKSRMEPFLEPRMGPRMGEIEESPSCSSSKRQLLQGLIFEGAFSRLNPHSLLPHLAHIDTTDQLQDFLDMANACIAASKSGNGKPIQNPQGFLFAQLRAGYINPPEGYKSRRIRAQEIRNQQLEAELAELCRLKEREQELQFELFKAKLTAEDLARLEQTAKAQIKPNLGLSPERQLEINKDSLLRQWFVQQEKRP